MATWRTLWVCWNRWNMLHPEVLVAEPIFPDPRDVTPPGRCCFCKAPAWIPLRLDADKVPYPDLEDI